MSCCDEVVKALLTSLGHALEECSELFQSRDVGSAFLSLQSMSSRDKEVIRVLKAVNNKLESMQETIQARTIADALFGLQQCRISDHQEVAKALHLIYSRATVAGTLSDLPSPGFSLSEVARSLYGLMCLLHKEKQLEANSVAMKLLGELLREARRLMLLRRIDNTIVELPILESQEAVMAMYRAVVLLSHNSLQVLPTELQESLTDIAHDLVPLLLSSSSVDSQAHESSTEKRFAAAVTTLLSDRAASNENENDSYSSDRNDHISVETSSFIEGFSCDIILRSKSSNDPLCNIELDGPSHLLPRKQLMCALRDAFLKDVKGVRVVRINLCEVPDRDDAFIASILKKKLTEFPPFAC
jgi:hypothetical protein